MNFRHAGFFRWLFVAVLLCCMPEARGQDKPGKSPKGKPAANKSADDEKMVKEDAKVKSGPKKERADAGAGSAFKGKPYRFKAEKKGAVAGAQMMTLVVEDPFTGKTENLAVPNNDADSKEYDPLTAVAEVVKEIKPGDILDIETEKQKGRTVVTSVARGDVKPGEELPNGFVFIESDETEMNGMPGIIVTLQKLGREVKVGVPFKKDDQYKDAQWEPDQKIDYVVRRLQSGTVVEALLHRGNPPMISEIYEYQPPERGKFVGVKDVEFNDWPAAGFEVLDDKGTTITFTLEGQQVTRNGKTVYQPNPQQLRAVQKIKADSEVEVRYKLDGRTWMLRDIKVLSPPPAGTAKKSSKAAGTTSDEKMGDEEKPSTGRKKGWSKDTSG